MALLAKASDDRSALLIAPTGAGKTLAGFLPTLVEVLERERVFDRFYRSAQAASANGSGLGLAIVKAVAQRHGANIALDDAPGGGLAVTVRFPR